MKKYLLLLLILSSCNNHKLVVIDGDTYIINGRHIRLLGVDCPELKQQYGHEAKMHVWGLLKNSEIRVDRIKKDNHGRWLSHVYFNGTPLDSTIVVNGWGWADTYNHINEGLMNFARIKQLGLWEYNAIEPYKFRRR